MNNKINIYIKNIYTLLSLISLIVIIKTPIKNYNNIKIIKYIFVIIAFLIYLLNININNYYINKFLLPLLLYLNLIILVIIEFKISKNIINSLFSCIGIFYILLIFNYKDFQIYNGLLIKPNKIWIYLQIICLIIFYIFSYFIENKIIAIIGVLYPLLFPINQYYYHRLFSLFFGYSFFNYIS